MYIISELWREKRKKAMSDTRENSVIVSCVPDLCHAGCARLAGQKRVIKRIFFVLEGRWYGDLPGSPFLRACSFLLFPYCFYYLYRSTTHNSVPIALFVRIPLSGPSMGLFFYCKNLIEPILGCSRCKNSNWAYSFSWPARICSVLQHYYTWLRYMHNSNPNSISVLIFNL